MSPNTISPAGDTAPADDPRRNHPNAPGRGPVVDHRDCVGSGRLPNATPSICPICGGSGLVPAWLYEQE